MAHLTIRGSLCRGVSCNEGRKHLQRGFVGKIKMVRYSYGYVDVIMWCKRSLLIGSNDVRVTNLQFLSEFCHFSHFINYKRQTDITF